MIARDGVRWCARTESIHERRADAQEVLGLSIARHREFEVQMNRLAQVRMTKRTCGSYLGRVLGPDPQPTEQDPEPEASAARQQVTANFDHPMQRLGTAHIAWSAVNAYGAPGRRSGRNDQRPRRRRGFRCVSDCPAAVMRLRRRGRIFGPPFTLGISVASLR